MMEDRGIPDRRNNVIKGRNREKWGMRLGDNKNILGHRAHVWM
jgi:hypothetical protein